MDLCYTQVCYLGKKNKKLTERSAGNSRLCFLSFGPRSMRFVHDQILEEEQGLPHLPKTGQTEKCTVKSAQIFKCNKNRTNGNRH